ncbi:hypothetical protein ACHQM5_010561 [Ranunculus cassubicifolius]
MHILLYYRAEFSYTLFSFQGSAILEDGTAASENGTGASELKEGSVWRNSFLETKTSNKLVSSIQEKLKHVSPLLGESCISRVPRALRKVNEDAYTPQVVSIGPYHHGSERLRAMEQHKVRYLSDFFERKPRHSLEDFVERLKILEESARQCYGPSIEIESDAFLEMMLLDGCFIIELIFKFCEKREEVMKKDPLFHIHSMIPAIRVDMLLLENQYPFVVLEQLLSLFFGDDPQNFSGSFCIKHVLQFFNFKYLLSMAQEDRVESDPSEITHFLDLLRECCLPSLPYSWVEQEEDHKFIPSATELHEAGVKFRKGGGNSFMDLKFTIRGVLRKKGVFEIPPLTVQDTTEVLFRNLIAFEQCFKTSGEQYVTHYLALLDFLINSPKDVSILRRSGIIVNFLGDNDQVSVLFNKIFLGVTLFADHFYFYKLSRDVNRYYNTPWHSFRAMLDREYFYSPWSTASSIAVIIVVVCTIIQAVCSVISVVP